MLSILLLMSGALLTSASYDPGLVFYQSRPDIFHQRLDIHLLNESLIEPGFIFWEATHRPIIYDSHGELVWYASSDGLSFQGTGLHVCDYDGKKGEHLCLFDGEQTGEYAHGMGYILDSSYRVVKVVQLPHGTDLHEFNLVDDGKSALLTAYAPVHYDLTNFNISNGVGWVEDSSFSEVDLVTGKVNFEWHSVDYFKPDPTTTIPIGSRGRNNIRPLDYFHINSVDKNSAGDYLISVRHMNMILKLSGEDGHIIWQLSNSLDSNFDLQNFNLYGQHHVRWVCENVTHTIISLFNNGANAHHNVNIESAGLQIAINHSQRTASAIQEIRSPTSGMLALSMGSMQPLTSGNAFMGWGVLPSMSEHLADGTTVFHASLPIGKGSYRSTKSSWKGQPTSPPDLWVYRRNRTSPMMTYMSWNGATHVDSWKIHVGSSRTGPFSEAGTVAKQGFETRWTSDSHWDWAYVEALSEKGVVLGVSRVMAVFMPPAALAATVCDDFGCPNAHAEDDDGGNGNIEFVSQQQQSPADHIGVVPKQESVDFILDVCSRGRDIHDSFVRVGVVASATIALIVLVVLLVSAVRERKSRRGPSRYCEEASSLLPT